MRIAALSVFACWLALAGSAAAQKAPREEPRGYLREELRIPMAEAGAKGLEAALVRPAQPGRYPLLLINHGAPRTSADRPGMTLMAVLPQMLEFARRGWAVASVMRRGFGDSGGTLAEGTGPCQDPNYVSSGRMSARDIAAAIVFLSTRADIDATRVVSLGISAGGLATVALTADPPPGLVAAISFAGGRGSPRDGEVCAEDRLVAAFATFGKTSRIPMLWLYADNDQFFGPELSQRFREAFAAGGGRLEFVKHPAFGRDGHSLFSVGIEQWTPYVDAFLQRQNLTLRKTLLPVPLPDIPVPRGLKNNGRKAFERYLVAGPHKAFAMAPSGAFGWRTARRTAQEARQGALDNCLKFDTGCRVIFVDETPAGP